MIALASSGDEAKIWDIPTFSLLEQFNSHDGPVCDLTWAYDGNIIATCCSSDKTVHIRSTNTSNSVVTDNFTLPSGSLCLDFNSTSRFLLCGCEDGSFHIWDRKTRTIKKSLSNQKNPITVSRWNWNDSYMALGLETGKIILYNVVTSQANSPMHTSSNQLADEKYQDNTKGTIHAIRQMKYNPYRKSSLITVADDGIVNFWDTNARRLLHSFSNTHQAPAKDLAFSPINDFLMVTVGLDKRAVFYDVQNKSSVKTIVADQPLTSVDMMPDGATVAVGTSRGNIFLYDMRQSATPVYTMVAHKSSVKKLSFVKKDDLKHESSNIRRQLPSTPLLSHEATHQNALGNSNHLTGVDVFSPLREVNKSSNNSLTEKSSIDRSWLYNKSGVADTTDAGLGIFSPLRHDNSLSVNSIHGTSSSLLANTSFLNQILSPSVNPVAERSRGLGNNAHNSLNGFFENVSTSQAPVTDVLSPCEEKSADLNINGDSLKHLQIDPSAPLTSRIASSSSPLEDCIPSHQLRSPPRDKSTPHRHSRMLQDDRVRADGLFTSSAVTIDNGLPNSPRDIRQRSEERKLSPVSSNKSGISTSPTAALSNLPQSSLRHLVQDLLREQFQEHHEHLKSEIRTMLGQTSESEQSRSVISARPDNPEIYSAEFIRNLIREELDDLKDFIHKEFWAVQVEVIKQAYQLQRYMEAGFAECLINPILLDEIDRLREENARLRKTF